MTTIMSDLEKQNNFAPSWREVVYYERNLCEEAGTQ